MRARAGLALLVAAALWPAAGCGGSKPEAFRIGVLVDCYGPFSTIYQASVASAELPLLERGGRLHRQAALERRRGCRGRGRSAELEIGCVAGNEDVIPEARRLVEENGAQAIVGPLDPQQGMALREYARTRPETAFLIQPSGAPELTLTDPAPNVFRFARDSAQFVAGLGAYAYDVLGWRKAAIVADDVPYSWGGAAGFVAEFCALGGRIVDRSWIPFGTDPAAAVPHALRADGVYLGPGLSPALGFVKRYAAAAPRPLASGWSRAPTLLYDPSVIALARGVVVAGSLPVEPTAAEAAYAAAFTKSFPAIPAAAAINPTTDPLPRRRRGAAGSVRAERRGNRRSAARLRLPGSSSTRRPAGSVSTRNRQAIGPNYLSRIATDAKGKPTSGRVRVVPNVEQTFGGYFKPGGPPPSRDKSPPCVKRTPPPWAR